jgi:hypothetical protein
MPRFLRNEDGSLSDDLNPEWVEHQNRYRAIKKAETEAILAELDELFDSKATDESVVDTPTAPVHHTATATPEKWVEIAPILVKVDGIQGRTIPDDTTPGPKKPIATTVPVMSEPQNHETDLASFSTDELLKLQKSLFSNDFTYTDTERALNREIALLLTNRGVSPIERDFPKYDRVACKTPAISAYMCDLQVFDLLWIWHTQNGHQTASEVHKGLFADIFIGDQFDFDRALAIAIGQFERKSGKFGNLTKARKIGYLYLPECWQEELAVLRTDAIRQRQDEAKNKARRAREELDALKVRAIDFRHRLDKYAKIKPIDTKAIDMDECVNIWIALQHSGGNTSNLSGIMAAYENLSGDSINKSKLRRRIELFQRASIL